MYIFFICLGKQNNFAKLVPIALLKGNSATAQKNSSGTVEDRIVSKVLNSEDEHTEYCKLKHSGNKKSHAISYSQSIQTNYDSPVPVACQTDDSVWDKKERPHKVENNLSSLQSKLRESLLADKERILSLKSIATPGNNHSISSPCPKNKEFTCDTTEVTELAKSIEGILKLRNSAAEGSPAVNDDESNQVPVCYPEVGASPSESKQVDKRNTYPFIGDLFKPTSNPEFSTQRVQTPVSGHPSVGSTNRLSCSTFKSKASSQSNSKLPTTDYPQTISKASTTPKIDQIPVDSSTGFSEGISHIIEERSRIQRKLLKLKVILIFLLGIVQ